VQNEAVGVLGAIAYSKPGQRKADSDDDDACAPFEREQHAEDALPVF
jgi:hypothetical protein